MSTTESFRPELAAQRNRPIGRRLWPAWAIIGLVAASVIYFQTIGVIDNGWSNALTTVAIGLGILLLGAWTAFFSPFSRATRWWCIAIAMIVTVALWSTLRISEFDGSLRAYLTWRWKPKPDVALAAKSLSIAGGKIDIRPTANDYPGFLGRNRDGYVPDVRLSTDWNARQPKLVWKQPIGAGCSAFAIIGNAAITLEQRDQQELVTCYNVKTGELAWFHAIAARHQDVIGGDGPESTPTIHDGRVYALGGTGVLRCLNAATGKPIWVRDVLADVGTTYEVDHSGVPWGRAASPLIVDDLVLVPGGGPPAGPKVSLVAYNKDDGNIVWKGGEWQISYSSPSIANYGGVRQVVIVNEKNISSHDPATGEVLWEAPWEGSSSSMASASQTVPVADDRFFVSKGYSMGGGALFEVQRSGGDAKGTWKIKKLWHNHRVLMTKFNNVIIKDRYVYGLSDGVLQCVELQTGKKRWAGDDYGHGQLLRVGDVLLVTGEWGAVALVAFDPSGFRELAKFQAIDGKTWNNPALSGNLLLVRNAQEAACYELPAE